MTDTLERVLRVMSRKQIRSIMECNARINLWHGAVRSGKTIASLLAFVFAVVQAPKNAHIFVVGKTQFTAEQNIIDVLMQHDGPFGPIARYVHHTRGARTATIFGRTVFIVGANDVSAETKIRGSTASIIYIDEVTLIPEGFFAMALSRLSVKGARLFGTTNADGPAHWLRQKYMLKTDLNMRQWAFNLDDNPFLEPDFVAGMKAELSGLWYRRFVLGEWCLAEGAVFDMWDPARHIVKTLPPIVEWVALGIDYGTTNPTAAELIGLGADGKLYVVSEYYYDWHISHRKKVEAEYAEEIKSWLSNVPLGAPGGPTGPHPRWTAIDPAAASFRLKMHEIGLASFPADNEVLPGLRSMSSLLATGRLLIHESCKGLITEIPGYSWDPDQAEKGKDEPIKVADHGIDAVRYGVYSSRVLWHDRLCPPDMTFTASHMALAA